MAADIRVKLTLDKNKFSTELTKVNNELKKNQEAVNKVDKAYNGQLNSLMALTKRQEALAKQQETLTGKADKLRQALDKANSDYEQHTAHLDKMQSLYGVLENELKEFLDSSEELQNLHALDNQLKATGQQIVDLQAEVKELEELSESLNAEGKKDTEEFRNAQIRMRELKEECERLSASSRELEVVLKKETKQHKDLVTEENQRTSQLKQLAKQMEAQQESVGKASDAIKRYSSELEATDKTLEVINTLVEKNKVYLDEAAASATGYATSIDGLGRTADQIDVPMKQMNEAFANFREDLKGDIDQLVQEDEAWSMNKATEIYSYVVGVVGDALQAIPGKIQEMASYAIEVGSSFEAEMSKVGAISGASALEVSQLTTKASEAARRTKYTASEAGEALGYMAMAGWKTEDMLGGLDGIMNLAAASGEDLATVSDIVTDALTAFGLSAKDAQHFADVMAVASSNANTNVSMMGETFKYVAPVAGSLGYSVEDVAEAIGLMANSGIKATQAGTSLRSIITRLSTDAGASSNKLGALGILTEKLGVQFYDQNKNARDFSDVLADVRVAWQELDAEQQQTYAKQIAGTNAISAWQALMNASVTDIEKLSNALSQADGTTQRMSDQMMANVTGSIEKLQSAYEGLGIAVYQKFGKKMRSTIDLFTDAVNMVTDWVNPAKSAIQEYIQEVEAGNEEVSRRLGYVTETINNAKLDVAKWEAYRDTLHEVVEHSITLSEVSSIEWFASLISDTEALDGSLKLMDEHFVEAMKKVGSFSATSLTGGELESSIDEISGNIDSEGEAADKAAGKTGAIGDVSLTDGQLTSDIETVADGMGDIQRAATTAKGKTEDLAEYNPDFAVTGKAQTVGEVFDGIASKIVGSDNALRQFAEGDIDGSKIFFVFDDITKHIEVLTEAEERAREKKGLLLGKTVVEGDKVFAGEVLEIQEALENCILVTDEFEKRKITKMMQEIGKVHPEYLDMWNEEYGILNKNIDVLDEYMKLQEAYALKSAFVKAGQDALDAWAETQVNLKLAENAYSHLLTEVNESLKEVGYEAVESFEELFSKEYDYRSSKTNVEFVKIVNDSRAEIRECVSALEDARKMSDEAHDLYANIEPMAQEAYESIEMTEEQVNASSAAVEEQNKQMQMAAASAQQLAEEEEEMGSAAEEAAQKEEELAKTIEDLTEKAMKGQAQGLKELREAWKDYVSDAKKNISSLMEMGNDPFKYAEVKEGEEAPTIDKLRNDLSASMSSVTQYRNDLTRLADRVGNGELSEEFYQWILEQGAENGALIHTLAEASEQELTGLNKDYLQSLQVSEEFSRQIGAAKMAMDGTLSKMNENSMSREELERAVQDAIEVSEEWRDIYETYKAEFEAVVEMSYAIGASIPDELTKGIKSGELSPEVAVGVINNGIQSRLSGLLEIATDQGISIPAAIADGIASGEGDMIGAYNSIIEAMAEEAHLPAKGKLDGSYYLDGFMEAINSDNILEILDAEGNVIDPVSDSIRRSVDGSGVGEEITQEIADGTKRTAKTVEDAAVEVVNGAASKATDSASTFTEAGENVNKQMESGLQSNRSILVTYIKEIAEEMIESMDSYGPKFETAGGHVPASVGTGLFARRSDVLDQVASVLSLAVSKIGTAKPDFERAGGDIDGFIAAGVSKTETSQSPIRNATNNALISARNGVSTDGWDSIGLNIASGIAKGVSDNQNYISNAVISALNNANAQGQVAIEIKSPSRKFARDIGQYIPLGIARGVDSKGAAVSDAVKGVLGNALHGGGILVDEALGVTQDLVEDKIGDLLGLTDALLSPGRGSAPDVMGELQDMALSLEDSNLVLAEAITNGVDVLDERGVKLIDSLDNVPDEPGVSLLTQDATLGDGKVTFVGGGEGHMDAIGGKPSLASASESVSAMSAYIENTSFEQAVTRAAESMDRLTKITTILVNAVNAISRSVNIDVYAQIGNEALDTHIAMVSQKAINEQQQQLSYAGGM